MSSVYRLRRTSIMFITAAVLLAPFIIWSGLSRLFLDPPAADAARGNDRSVASAQPIKPARSVALSAATQADLVDAFAFSNIGIFPNSDLIYVQRANTRYDEGELIDRSGRWLAAAEYSSPNFSGDAADGLFPARHGQEYGYIDGRGAWAIKPQFRQALPFKHGIAVAYSADGGGVIGTDGKWRVPAKHKLVSVVASGWVVADDAWYVQDSKWYTLGTGGSWKQIANSFSSIQPFNDRLAVGRRNDEVMLVDRSGSPATTERYQYLTVMSEGRALASQQGKWGMVGAQGEWLIAPQYDVLYVNGDGSVQAQLQGKSLLLDNDGKPRTPTNYRLIGKPSGGLTAACQDLRCGYMDSTGKWAIAPQFDYAYAFSDGVARVTQYGLTAYINRSGRLLTPEPPAMAAAPMLWAIATIGEAARSSTVYGYLDRSGRLAIPGAFSNAGDFSENLAPVQAANGEFGYIGLDGRWAIPPVFRQAGPFAEGWALVGGSRLLSGPSVYIDAQGHEQLRLPPEFHAAGGFQNGKASVLDSNERPVMIDKSGKIVAADAPATHPSEPPALQRLSINGGKWGYADARDRFVIAPQFDDAGEFAGDLAPVRIGGKWGYIDRAGKIKIRPSFDEVGLFSEGLARVRLAEQWTFIDPLGRAISADTYVVAGDFHGGRAKVGIDLETARRHAAGIDSDASGSTAQRPPMLAEGGDMQNGATRIKLMNNGYYNNYLVALMNSKGELVIPAVMPPRPAANR